MRCSLPIAQQVGHHALQSSPTRCPWNCELTGSLAVNWRMLHEAVESSDLSEDLRQWRIVWKKHCLVHSSVWRIVMGNTWLLATA
mmetsp:Transcript_11310/g.42397  ORF Transcript_11310/g.42397 Transcript_11310/m.42397 type:complete len:85 (-) Transcript_11310:3452-3706(-)